MESMNIKKKTTVTIVDLDNGVLVQTQYLDIVNGQLAPQAVELYFENWDEAIKHIEKFLKEEKDNDLNKKLLELTKKAQGPKIVK